jgi:hypothetical protein
MKLIFSSDSAELKVALDQFQSNLTQDQTAQLRSISSIPDANAVIIFTTQLDEENAKRNSRCVASRLYTFLQSIQQFASIVETFVSSNPRIAALVWGSVKFALLVSASYILILEIAYPNSLRQTSRLILTKCRPSLWI